MWINPEQVPSLLLLCLWSGTLHCVQSPMKNFLLYLILDHLCLVSSISFHCAGLSIYNLLPYLPLLSFLHQLPLCRVIHLQPPSISFIIYDYLGISFSSLPFCKVIDTQLPVLSTLQDYLCTASSILQCIWSPIYNFLQYPSLCRITHVWDPPLSSVDTNYEPMCILLQYLQCLWIMVSHNNFFPIFSSVQYNLCTVSSPILQWVLSSMHNFFQYYPFFRPMYNYLFYQVLYNLWSCFCIVLQHPVLQRITVVGT